MILFSYEVDVLEIALHEAQDLVEKIVIVEASHSHRGVSHVLHSYSCQLKPNSFSASQASDVGAAQVDREVQFCEQVPGAARGG